MLTTNTTTPNNDSNKPKNTNDKITNLTILQLNSSNSDWSTKRHELMTTINNNDADVVIVSEANVETTNPEKMEERKLHCTISRIRP